MKIAFNKRTGLIGSAILILMFFAFSSGKNSADNSLLIGISGDYPPFEFHKDGELAGIDIDVAHKIADSLGRKIQWQQLSFDNLIGALESKRVDMVISALTETPERLKRIDFSELYYENSFAVVYRNGLPIKSLQDMHGKKIGVQTGTSMAALLKKAALTNDIKEFSLNNNNILIEELKLGRIDGVILENVSAIEYVKANPSLRSAELFAVNDGQGYAIAFPKDSPLKEKVNKILLKMKNNGELAAIIARWESKMQIEDAAK